MAGRGVLHLQCHFGLDTLSVARMGAEVTGLDFSRPALEAARALSRETGVPGTFVESEVLRAPESLRDFDLVFATWGAICWVEDLAVWMRIAASVFVPSLLCLVRDLGLGAPFRRNDLVACERRECNLPSPIFGADIAPLSVLA